MVNMKLNYTPLISELKEVKSGNSAPLTFGSSKDSRKATTKDSKTSTYQIRSLFTFSQSNNQREVSL